jgi:hypothetical protein
MANKPPRSVKARPVATQREGDRPSTSR